MINRIKILRINFNIPFLYFFVLSIVLLPVTWIILQGCHVLSVIVIIHFIIFFIFAPIILFLNTYDSMRLSDLFITDDKLILVYKCKNKVIKKAIAKDSIKNFNVNIDSFIIRGRGTKYSWYHYSIYIENKNLQDSATLNFDTDCPRAILIDLLKYREYIPGFSYNITGNDIFIKEFAEYYIKNGKFPKLYEFYRFFIYIVIIILTIKILIIDYELLLSFFNVYN